METLKQATPLGQEASIRLHSNVELVGVVFSKKYYVDRLVITLELLTGGYYAVTLRGTFS